MFPLIAGYALGSRAAAKARATGIVADHMFGLPDNDLIELEERIDRLTRVIEAMWALLKENGYTDEQLVARIEELETAEEQRVTRLITCRSCDSRVPEGMPRCQICGTETGSVSTDPFDNV
jgi:NADH:ubiquinone oxidoreductase subunit E